MPELTPDIGWLVAVLILNLGLLSIVLMLQPLVRDLTLGIAYATSSLDDRREESKLGRRLAMVKDNQIEALVLFAPLVLIGWLSALSHPHLSLIASAFLAARLAHAVISAAGLPLLRSAVWIAGFAATLYLGWIVWSGIGGAA